jgi:HSP90 family molecular chaperone
MGSQFDEEAVTVNTRALIDKVLARYSGEWTTLRELIQNAADAQATRVTIRFETNPSADIPLPQSQSQSDHLKHVLLHHTLKTLMVSNNGETFAETDWQRLKRIAEGNPDETKIGAFGVGFYSVFADCESPFVSSGNRNMAFYWKKDSLFTRRGKLPDDQAAKDTTFLLDYRPA